MDHVTPMASKCRVASPHDSVSNSECGYTFHSPYTTPQGILVNLSSFAGTCEELAVSDSNASPALYIRIVKRRESKEKPLSDSEGGEGQEEKELASGVTKLGVGVEGGFQSEKDMFETISTHSIVVLDSENKVLAELPYDESTKTDFPTQVSLSADSIIHHAGMAVQQDLKAWELDDEPKPVSKYFENLPFVENGKMISPNPNDWKCEISGDKENLWLNLSDGFIGGGRKNWDGSGGSNGALDHFVEAGEKYPLVVKLGTITEDIDTADCYSYAKDEDGPVKIPNLAELLARRGIKVAGLQKTVKSTAELEVELNATYAFDAITESGANLVPVSGPGLQGLQNLGNSCYINTAVQLLLGGTVAELSARYGTAAGSQVTSHPFFKIAPNDAADDILCQTTKLANALTSGIFAGPLPDSAAVTDEKSAATDPKYRLTPRMFKHAVAKNHAEFRTGQQQDSAEFLQYFLETLDRAELGARGTRLTNKADSSKDAPLSSWPFAHKITSRLVCSADNLVKYNDGAPETLFSLPIPMEESEKTDDSSDAAPDNKRQKSDVEGTTDVPTVTFQACLDAWAGTSELEGMRWPHLKNNVHNASVQNRLANFPRYLLVHLQRYELGPDWVPRKLEVNIDMPQQIDLEFLKTSRVEGETLVPEENENAAADSSTPAVPAGPTIDENAVGQLMDMGFNMNGCKRALVAVGGSNVEAAMNWIFEHNCDPDFNDPLPESGTDEGQAQLAGLPFVESDVDEGTVMSLVENLGCFTADQVRAALKHCDGASDRAADWLFSHMDDLDGAIAALKSKKNADPPISSAPSPSLDDGEGKYTLVGLISHIGKNTGSGHYVCHLLKDGKWVIFNDEKVALSESPPLEHAYVYLFQRNDSIGSPDASY